MGSPEQSQFAGDQRDSRVTVVVMLMALVGAHLAWQLGGAVPRSLAAEPPAAQVASDEQESDDLRSKAPSKKPLLVQMAEEHGYRLAEGEDIRRVPPPFDPIRAKYYRTAHEHQAAAINDPPTTMTFYWSDVAGGRLEHWGMTFGGQSLAMLIDSVTGIKDQMIEGPKELLRKEITGDWIVRVGTKDFQRVKQLDKILREELQLPLHLQLLEVERPVFVLSGEYRYQPLDKQFFETKWRKVDIFGKARNPNSGAGGGSGDFSDMLQWVGRWINTPVISDLASPPDDSFTWQLHLRHPDTKQTQAEDHDPQMVMANFAAQTGLKFAQETRPVRILFVKRDE